MGPLRVLLLGVWLLGAHPAAAGAAPVATLASTSGAVTLSGRMARSGDAVYAGMEIATGPSAQALVRFLDEQRLLLDEYTRVYIAAYEYDTANRAGNRSHIELIEGRLRYVAGHMAWEAPERVVLATPVAALDVHNADFTVAGNGLYLAVSRGLVAAGNAVGMVAFSQGQAGLIPANGAAPQVYSMGQLPANVAFAFNRLSAVPLSEASPPTAAPAAAAQPSAAGDYVTIDADRRPAQ